MRTLTIASAAVVLLFSSSALAGQRVVPQSTLDSMGLVSMQQLSDDAGQQVRGKGDNNFFSQILIRTNFIQVKTSFSIDAAIKIGDLTTGLSSWIGSHFSQNP